MEEFRKEYLGSGITAFVSAEHTFGTDAVLLADFAAPKKRTDAATSEPAAALFRCSGARAKQGKSSLLK